MWLKSFKMIRTVGIAMLMLQISISAAGQGNITLRKQRIKAIDLIREIKKQTGYNILYSNQVLNDDRLLYVEFKNATLHDVMTTLLQDQNLSYDQKDNTLLITPARENIKTAGMAMRSTQQPVKGLILDHTGKALSGATVVIKGSNKGVKSNADGYFTISDAKAGDVLSIRYVGYITQEVTVENVDKEIQIRLIQEESSIDEIVVTALGIKRSEKALSYNVQQVKGEDLTQVRDANMINSLSGKIAGVTINSSSGGIGGAVKVVMRGAKTIEQDNNVLYVIDGIPMFNKKSKEGSEFASTGTSEGIADLNPEDIESMSVLTGAAAAALYGSDAANGAIVINTRKGVSGKTSLSFTQNTQFHNAFVMPSFQNRYGTGSGLASGVNDKSWGARLTDVNNYNYSPTRDYLQTGISATEGISFSTGTDKNQTYVSAGAVNATGIIPNNKYDRYNLTVRNTSRFLDDKLTLDAGLNYIRQRDLNMTNQGIYSNPLTTAYLFPRGDDWDAIRMYERYNVSRKIYEQYWPQGLNEISGQNPYWINHRNLRETNKDRYMINVNLSYQINDWLSLSARGRMDNTTGRFTEKLYASTNTTIAEGSENGFFGLDEQTSKQYYGDIMANINKSFNDFTLQANVGAIILHDKIGSLPIRGPILENGLTNKFDITQIDSRKRTPMTDKSRESQSIFTSLELGYKNTYFVTATGRNDWPSQLAGPKSTQPSFFYPSIGATAVLSQIVDMSNVFQYLKVRSSYASVGRPYPEFLANPVYEWDVATQQYKGLSHYPISILKPERTNSAEVGFNARFLNGFNLDLTLYHASTLNQTFNPQLSVSSGYNRLFVQTGKVVNRGIEISLGYEKKWDDFQWNSNYTLTVNRNEIKELVRNYVHPETGATINKNRLDVGGLSQAKFILKEGGTLGDLYSLSDLLRDDNGMVYVTPDGKVINNNNVGDILLGSIFPKSNMAWRNGFQYKNWMADFTIAARFGGVVYSATQAYMDYYGVSEASAQARDDGGIIINGTDRVNAEAYYNVVGLNSGIPQFYTYSATNVRLQEATVGYTFPKSFFGDKAALSINFVGRNLWMIYNKAPFDPESTATTGNYYQGIDYFMTPSTRNLGFNVRLKF
ncbi:SusC/RagA family TonB-linked outer membrane protein [Sphingobacterium sp. C459-1T]|uniref:SusC/RagA family TonB-linked outer membrane protein n=2 Tax=Sphingobacterium faecale TaxID=2803775 RepID=A0ABS1QZ07_9SPHI|nr:SusC/RagA family TonB-linked outer membrane protein [Sphingobacterium faecale]